MPLALALRMGPWLAILILIGALAVQTDRLHGAQDARDNCKQGRVLDRQGYEQAQREAAAKNKAQVAQIEKQQQEANDEVTRNLHSRLEQLRRELRSQAGTAQGSAGGPGVPQAGGQPGTAQAAGVCLTAEEHVRAAESEERHDQLITLIERMVAGPDSNRINPADSNR